MEEKLDVESVSKLVKLDGAELLWIYWKDDRVDGSNAH